MASQINIENVPTNLFSLDNSFAGRADEPGYEPTKLIHIHRRNRAYVWSLPMRQRLLDSILKGYPIPPIYCDSRIVNGRERREIMDGGNRMTTIRRILAGEVRELTVDERRIIEATPITLVVMRNLNTKQIREVFGRINKNVKVSDGQLYAMSEDDSPLVRYALSFLNDDQYPLRNIITDYFFDTRGVDSAGRSNLENAIALVSGALYGPEYITKSFARQEERVEDQNPVNSARAEFILGKVFDVFRMANEIAVLTDKRKMKAQFTVGNFLGTILYDILMNLTAIADTQAKWVMYLVKLRNNEENATEAVVVPGAQNINLDKLKRISVKVDVYLTENRILLKEELKLIRHPLPVETDDEDEDDDDDSV